jgi:hypothetical protein
MKSLLKFIEKNYMIVILFFVLLFSIYFLNNRFNIIEGLKKKRKPKKSKKSKKSKKPKKSTSATVAATSIFGGTIGYSTQDDINNNKNTIAQTKRIFEIDGTSYSDKINLIKEMLDGAIIKDDIIRQIVTDGEKAICTSIYTHINEPKSNIEKSLVEQINGLLNQEGKSYSDKIKGIKFILTDTSLYNKKIDKIIFDGEKEIIDKLNTYIKLLEQQFNSI